MQIHKIPSKFANLLAFIKAFMINPREIGAISPSSRWLAKEMVAHVNLPDDTILVELGAGTGVITEALLHIGIKPQNLIVIEYSPKLVEKLRMRFPMLQIIEGDAANIEQLLANKRDKVNTIISSLPLRSLPKERAKIVLDHVQSILPSGGKYIQFTYSFLQNHFGSLADCHIIFSKRIWFNLPPARVDVFQCHRESH